MFDQSATSVLSRSHNDKAFSSHGVLYRCVLQRLTCGSLCVRVVLAYATTSHFPTSRHSSPPFFLCPRRSVSPLFLSGLEPALFERPQLHFIATGWRPLPQQPSRTSIQQPLLCLRRSQWLSGCARACHVLSSISLSLNPHLSGSLSPPQSPTVRPPPCSPSTHCRCKRGHRGLEAAAVPGLGARLAMARRLMLALPVLLFLLLVGELLVVCCY
jgi:hypothetical protein